MMPDFYVRLIFLRLDILDVFLDQTCTDRIIEIKIMVEFDISAFSFKIKHPYHDRLVIFSFFNG